MYTCPENIIGSFHPSSWESEILSRLINENSVGMRGYYYEKRFSALMQLLERNGITVYSFKRIYLSKRGKISYNNYFLLAPDKIKVLEILNTCIYATQKSA